MPGSCEGGGLCRDFVLRLLVRVSLLRGSPFCDGKADGQGVIFWCGFVQKGDPAGLFLKRGGFVAFFCNREPHLEGLVRGVSSLPAGGRRGKPLPDLRSRVRFCGGLSMDCIPCGYTIYIRGLKMLLKRLKQRGFYDKIEA